MRAVNSRTAVVLIKLKKEKEEEDYKVMTKATNKCRNRIR